MKSKEKVKNTWGGALWLVRLGMSVRRTSNLNLAYFFLLIDQRRPAIAKSNAN